MSKCYECYNGAYTDGRYNQNTDYIPPDNIPPVQIVGMSEESIALLYREYTERTLAREKAVSAPPQKIYLHSKKY